MVLTDLPLELQTLQLFQFEMFTRAFWLFIIISFSLIYVFYWRKYNEKKTPFYSLAFVRGTMHIFAVITLIVSPLLFLGMSPQDAGMDIIMVFVIIYVTLLSLYLLLVNLDLIRYGISSLFISGGLNLGDEKDKLAFRKLYGKR